MGMGAGLGLTLSLSPSLPQAYASAVEFQQPTGDSAATWQSVEASGNQAAAVEQKKEEAEEQVEEFIVQISDARCE